MYTDHFMLLKNLKFIYKDDILKGQLFHSLIQSQPPFPLRLQKRPALQPGNVMSAQDLLQQVSLHIQSTPVGAITCISKKLYLSEKSSHLFFHLKTIKINSERRSDHYGTMCHPPCIAMYFIQARLLCCCFQFCRKHSYLLAITLMKTKWFSVGDIEITNHWSGHSTTLRQGCFKNLLYNLLMSSISCTLYSLKC